MKFKKIMSTMLICSLTANASYAVFADEYDDNVSSLQTIEDDLNKDNDVASLQTIGDNLSEDADASSSQTIEEDNAEDVAVFPMADDENKYSRVYDCPATDANGKATKVSITIRYAKNGSSDYYNSVYGEAYGIITNVSNTAAADMVIPNVVTLDIDGTQTQVIIRSVGENAFQNSTVTSVTLPETIKQISSKAFIDCKNLKSVTIKSNKGMKEDGTLDFRVDSTDDEGNIVPGDIYLSGKTYYIMPTSIGDSAFSGCTSLETVNISGIQTIGASVFAGCTALKNVNFDFSNMYGLVKATTIQKGSRLFGSIGDYAFDGCTALESITLPDGLQTIGANKFFKDCSALESVEIGLNLSSGLSADSFSGCSSLEEINVAGSDEDDNDPSQKNDADTEGSTNCWNKKYRSIDGVLYNCANETRGTKIVGEDGKYLKDDNGNDKFFITVSKLIAYPAAKPDKDYIAPDTLEEIAENVFENNTNVENVVINTTPGYKSSGTGVTATEVKVNIDKNAFLNCQSLKKLQINNVCTIAESAFDGCTNLQTLIHDKDELTSNKKITSTIGKYAFRNCALDFSELNYWASIGEGAFTGNKNINKLVLNSTVGTLGANAFSNCTGLKSVDATNWNNDISTNPTLGKGVFKGCTALETVVMNDNLLELTAETFMGCSSLTNVTLGENTADISDSAFSDCTSLEHFKGNKFLVKIATNAFANCTALEDVTLTRSVKIVAANSFDGCTSLTTFYAPEGSYVEEFAGGSIRDVTKANGSTTPSTKYDFSAIPNEIRDKDYLIFDDVKITDNQIDDYDNRFITEDESGNHYVKVVKGYRGGFEKLTFNEVGKLAGDEAITPYIAASFISKAEKESMTKILKAVDLSGMEVIGDSSFSGCTNLTTVVFDDNLKTIGKTAFSNCSSLCSTDKWEMSDQGIGESGDVVIADDASPVFTIPKNCESIGENAFLGCNNIKQLDLTAMTTGTVGKGAFSNCKALTNVLVGDGITALGDSAFSSCTSLKSVSIGEGCTSIGASAFSGCTSLKSVSIGEGCTSIGKTAFNGCKALEDVELGSNISTMGQSAFANCTSLKKIVLPAALLTLQTSTFSGCTSLENVIFNQGLEKIQSNAFNGCTALKVVSLNTGLSVEAKAFAGCTNIETVVIPPTVKIGSGDDDPFPAADKFTIYCTEGGQAATYVKAKESAGCTLQPVEFVDNYSKIKVTTTIPDYVTVTNADGNVIKSGDVVYTGDVLTVKNANGGTDAIYASGTSCEEGTYTVAQDDYDILFGYMGDLDFNGKIDHADVAILLKHLSGADELNSNILKFADVKVDNTEKKKYGVFKGVDMLDAIEIANIADNK